MKLEVRNGPPPLPPPPPEREYVVSLTQYEAEVLRTTAWKIGGPPSGARGVWEDLSRHLDDAGVEVQEERFGPSGSIYFK